jgi:hypothetical protein
MAEKKVPPVVIEVDRSSITGKFVTGQFADRHPKTTEHERYKVQPQPPTKRGK